MPQFIEQILFTVESAAQEFGDGRKTA